MKGAEMVKLYEENGWQLDRINGSHHIMVKEGRRPQPIPVHKAELGKGLEQALLKRMKQ